MAWATDEPGDFTEFYRADVPAGQSHWHYNADVEVKLDAPAKTVFIRYAGVPASTTSASTPIASKTRRRIRRP